MSDGRTKTVVAFDPGGTTGWALYRKTPEGVEKWLCGQIGPHEHHGQLYAMLEHEHTSIYTVVCESFEFRQGAQRANLNLMSKEYIGTIKTFCQIEDVPLFMQTAAIGKGFVDDKKLKVMKLWYPGQKHAMDAMRHLVTYLVQKEKRVDLIRSWKGL